MAVIDRVIGLLVYEDIPAAHDWLVKVFGLTPGGVYRDAQGSAVHGEVRAGEFVIWMHRVTAEFRLDSAQRMDVASGGLVVLVDDVDAHYAHAKAQGARVDREPRDQPYGHRDYGVTDLEGHRWWFATPVKKVEAR